MTAPGTAHAGRGVGQAEKKMKRKGSEAFFEPPEALPSHGSIPSARALDPEIERARQEMIDSQSAPAGG